jgi:hypothetical protein
MADRILLANWIMCPDGTMMPSFHTHDFRTRKDDQGRISTVDGGIDYLRRAGEYTEMSIYSDDPFEVIRCFVCRGSRGINGDEPLHYIPLCKMTNEHLVATIEYNNNNNIDSIYQKYYYQELTYRSYDYNIPHDKN